MANDSIPDDGGETPDGVTDTPGISIKAGIKQYLKAVEATKGFGTHDSYQTCLAWAERHITKHLINRLNRNDLLGLFAAGREEGLNQKTINKRVTVVLNMVRHHDHDIKLKRGDWPKTTEKKIEVYINEEIKNSSQPVPMMSVCCLKCFSVPDFAIGRYRNDSLASGISGAFIFSVLFLLF